MDFHGVHFADPIWLLGLFALPLIFLAAFFISRAKYTTFSLGNPRLVEMASGFFSVQFIPWLLRFVVIALCLIAAARPQAGQKKVEEKKPVTDLFVALDVSGSMMTPDLKPNRITAAKKLLSEFLDKVQNVRVGVTIFARISFTQCPLTTDIDVVKQLLSNVLPAPYSIKLDGTAIGDALVACLGRLENGDKLPGDKKVTVPSLLASFADKTKEDDADATQGHHQAIILLTDGGDNASQINPLIAAKIAASRGVKIYTIGIGSLKPVPMVFVLPNGQTVYGGIDPRTGRVQMSDPVEMGLLNEIARITGAKSYSAENNKSLQEILDEIAKLEKTEISETTHWEYNELAPYFLITAFLILALNLILEMTFLRILP
jgi:Ca-activated chloride channel family protein